MREFSRTIVHMSSKKAQRLGLGTLALGVAVASAMGVGAACGEKRGAIMLAVSTDMKAPKDVNIVTIHVQTGSLVRHNFIGRVTPEGEVVFPATLAIIEPDDPNASIRVRVIALKDNKPLVLRDVRTTAPHGGRVALLRLPLLFVNQGVSVSGTVPDNFLPPKSGPSIASVGRPLAGGVSPRDTEFNPYDPTQGVIPGCGADLTYIDGDGCKDSYVDSSALPDYSDEAVFGSGGPTGCFDTKTCFGAAKEIPADVLDVAACAFPLGARDPAKLNLALATPDVGECVGDKCFVPIDRGDGGWRVEGTTVKLPVAYCKSFVAPGKAKIVETSACGTKAASQPLCQDKTAGSSGTAELVARAEKPSLVVVGPNGTLYFGAVDGLYSVSATANATPSALIKDTFAAQWSGTSVGDSGAFANGPRAFVLNGNKLDAITGFGADVLQGAAILSGFAYFASTGNIYKTPITSGSASAISMIDTPTTSVAAVPASPIAIFGTANGALTNCDTKACAPSPVIPPNAPAGRIDAIALRPSAQQALYVVGDGPRPGVYALDGVQVPPLDSRLVAASDVKPFSDPSSSQRFGRPVAANDRCVFFADAGGGMAYRGDLSTATPIKPLVAGAADKPVLALAPDLGTSPKYVYYAVYAPAAAGGGIYRVPIPSECVGGASASDAGACTPPGQACTTASQCCFGPGQTMGCDVTCCVSTGIAPSASLCCRPGTFVPDDAGPGGLCQ